MSKLTFLEKLLDGAEVEWLPFGEISIKISSGGTPKTDTVEYYNGDIPWLRTQEINFNEIWDTAVKITKVGLENSSAKWIPANCLIIAMYGATVGKVGINKIPMSTNQACANIQLDEKIANYRYIFHFLSKQYKYIKSLGCGSQTNINANIIKKLQIPIPCPNNPKRSLAIQAEIVRILDKFHKKTKDITEKIEKVIEMRKKQLDFLGLQLFLFDKKTLEALKKEEEVVAWFPLDDKRFFINANNKRKYIKASLRYGGNTPYYSAGSVRGYVEGYTHNGEYVLLAESCFRPKNDYPVNYVNGKFWAGSDVYVFRVNELVNTRYLYYYLKSFDFSSLWVGSIQVRLPKEKINKIKIPIPYPNNPKKSLKAQAEIVRILDKFTELIKELKEEIKKHKKRYQYYRDQLLTFDKDANVEWKKLGDKKVGIFIKGSSLQKKDFTKTGVGCIHYGQIYTHYATYTNRTKTFVSAEFAKKARKAQSGNLIIATTSENDEDVCEAVTWVGDEDIAVSSDACIYKHKLNPKYVSYFFQTEQFQKQKRQYITGVKVRRVNADNLAKIEIPIPSLKEQARIVAILDKFDTMTNSISENLEQYIIFLKKIVKYYYKLLFSFQKEKTNNVK